MSSVSKPPPTVSEGKATAETGEAESLTLAALGDNIDVERVQNVEEQPLLQPHQQSTSPMDKQEVHQDNDTIAEIKRWIRDCETSIDEINSRISIAENAFDHLENLQEWLANDENLFLGVALDPDCSITINRAELRKFVEQENDSLEKEKVRLQEAQDRLKKEEEQDEARAELDKARTQLVNSTQPDVASLKKKTNGSNSSRVT